MTGLLTESLKASIQDLKSRIGRLEQSCNVLSNQSSGYAQEHLRLIEAHRQALAVYEKFLKDAQTRDTPTTPD